MADDHFNEIKNVYTGVETKSLIGIITPFKKQVSVIRRALSHDIKPFIDVGMVACLSKAEKKDHYYVHFTKKYDVSL